MKKVFKNQIGITLVSLVITIIILLILAGISILALTENGLFFKANQATSKYEKQTATEKMNLKITNVQMESYAEKQQMPTLQYLADKLCEDDEMQYVTLKSQAVASLEKITVGDANSIFTKLKDYPYEFEINSSLQLASIDGVKVSTNTEVTLDGCSRYIKVNVSHAYWGNMTLSVDIPESDNIKSINYYIDNNLVY